MPELRRNPVTRLICAGAAVATLVVATAACGRADVAGPDTSAPETSAADAPGPTSAPTASATRDRATALHPTVEAFIDAWNADDVAAFVATFAEEAVLIDAGRRMDGGEAIGEFAGSELMNYDVRVLSAESATEDGQVLLAQVSQGGGDGFRASFEFTLRGGLITVADLSFA